MRFSTANIKSLRRSNLQYQPLRVMRFTDLKQAQIVTNWPQLGRLIKGHGFPPGYLISPGARVWDPGDIEAWLQTRREQCSGTATAEAA